MSTSAPSAVNPVAPPDAPARKRPTGARRVHTPPVMQMETAECGAAALAIVLAHYGRHVPLVEMRNACGVSRDGSKAHHILTAARRYGLQAAAFRYEMTSLQHAHLPLIVWWDFNHFLVVEGYDQNKVYLNDPDSGQRTVSWEDFDRSFTGVALVMEPGPEFKKGGHPRSSLRALADRLHGSEMAVLFVAFTGLALVLPGMVVPTFLRVFIDQVLIAGSTELVQPLLIGMALTAVLRAGLSWMQDYYLLRLETKLALTMSSKFFWHVLRLPIEFFTQRSGGEVGSRVGLNDDVAELLSGDLAKTLIDVMLVVFYAILMLQYDLLLTMIGVGIAMLNIGALRFVARVRTDGNRKLLQERGKFLGTAINGLQMIETLKASAAESDFFSRWSGYLAKVMNAQQEIGVPTRFLSAVPPLLSALNITTILLVGSMKVINGEMTVGMLIAFQSLMGSFIGPFNQIVNLGGAVQEIDGALTRLDDVLGNQPDPEIDAEAHGAHHGHQGVDQHLHADGGPHEHHNGGVVFVPWPSDQPRLSGHIELRGVTFGYNRLEPALIEGFNLMLKPGSRVALVGGSGSGKSTLAKVVTGLYEPWAGEILFDGKPRRQIPRAVVNNSIALVDQDIHLFEGSIRDNLTVWDDSIPERQMVQAAKDACIHEAITDRAGGYDYLLSEGGTNFSGGQRQRLEIARALVNNPTILVLDEATSALDPATEQIIDDNLRRRGCTCLIIAHRLSTIRDCDEIVVLEYGKVVQRGTHEELFKVDGTYARLIRAEAPKSRPKHQSVLESLYAKS